MQDYTKPVKRDEHWTVYTNDGDKVYGYFGNEKNAKAYAIRHADYYPILIMHGYREIRKEHKDSKWTVSVYEE